MIYEFECQECGVRCEASMSMKVIGSSEEPEVLCPECDRVCKRLVSGGVGFVLKGGGWPGKSDTTHRQKEARSKEMEVRQFRKHGLDGGHSLVPNVDGEICKDWKEAKDLARSKGKVEDPMFDHMIFREDVKKEIVTRDQVGYKPVVQGKVRPKSKQGTVKATK